MDTDSPLGSILSAFYELGKRIGLFFACLLVGNTIGYISSMINKLAATKEEVVVPEEEDILGAFSRFKVIASQETLIGIIGYGLIVFSMVRILKGDKLFIHQIFVVIGGALGMAILYTRDAPPTLLLWGSMVALMILAMILRKKYFKSQDAKWEDGIAAIKEENKQRREELGISLEDDLEDTEEVPLPQEAIDALLENAAKAAKDA